MTKTKHTGVTLYLKECVRKAKVEIPNHIEPIDEQGEYDIKSKASGFNYYTFTKWCLNQFDEYENVPDLAYLIRDLAMEAKDRNYNAMASQTKFNEMDMLD